MRARVYVTLGMTVALMGSWIACVAAGLWGIAWLDTAITGAAMVGAAAWNWTLVEAEKRDRT